MARIRRTIGKYVQRLGLGTLTTVASPPTSTPSCFRGLWEQFSIKAAAKSTVFSKRHPADRGAPARLPRTRDVVYDGVRFGRRGKSQEGYRPCAVHFSAWQSYWGP